MKAKSIINVVVGLMIGFSVTQTYALATLLGDPKNGENELNSKCTACHIAMFGGDGSKIYTREDHRVRSVEGLMAQVERCNVNTQNGALNQDQMDDITAHLNEVYYKFED